ncbi:cytochrome c oxidase subunit VIa-domain-containing protein [Lipomyces oligophaga]|uniref:cytochrome c oxidase subunit VIa-domain-containing protein n=1 Tax=Lipomyces oligophaga TaxID=45792 RepID=UPI0034CE635B
MSAVFRGTLARPAVRPTALLLGNSRRGIHKIWVPNPEKAKAFREQLEAVQHHAGETSNTWAKITFFLAIPLCVIACARSYKMESEHIAHVKHEYEHFNEDDAPAELPYMNVRAKDFFWGDGDKTLFWNPAVNHHKR